MSIMGPPVEALRLVGWDVSGARVVENESRTEVTAVLSPILSSGFVIAVMKSKWLGVLKILATLSWEEGYIGHCDCGGPWG